MRKAGAVFPSARQMVRRSRNQAALGTGPGNIRSGRTRPQTSFAHALPTSHIEDPDLALIVGVWDRLADECKARLIEVIRENLPSETLPTLPTSPRKVRSITPA